MKDKWETYNLKFRKREKKRYILGGKIYSKNHKLEYLDNTIEIYDIKKDTLIVDNSNPHQAVNAASFIFEDNIILIRGSIKTYLDGGTIFTHKVHILDLNTGTRWMLCLLTTQKKQKELLFKRYIINGRL